MASTSHLEQSHSGQHIDPVCGMTVDEDSEFQAKHQGKDYFFCSGHCQKEFLSHPEGFQSTSNESQIALDVSRSVLKTYFPLILILAYLMGGVLLVEVKAGYINGPRMMAHFMGGFFMIFSFFKFLDLNGFAEAYQTYDIVAKRFPFYARIYPFIELGLGIAYFSATELWTTHLITLIVMSVSSVGVAKSILKKSKIQCACLGTVFKLPMTKITLFEDLMMVGMALVGLIFHGG